VKRLGTAAISGRTFSATFDQRLRDLILEGCRRHVQGGIAFVHVMGDWLKEVGLRTASGSSFSSAFTDEYR
jgi:hypothetical protein